MSPTPPPNQAVGRRPDVPAGGGDGGVRPVPPVPVPVPTCASAGSATHANSTTVVASTKGLRVTALLPETSGVLPDDDLITGLQLDDLVEVLALGDVFVVHLERHVLALLVADDQDL